MRSLFLSARPVRAATFPELLQDGVLDEFLSARPVRAATGCSLTRLFSKRCFYPRDPCGPRPYEGHT